MCCSSLHIRSDRHWNLFHLPFPGTSMNGGLIVGIDPAAPDSDRTVVLLRDGHSCYSVSPEEVEKLQKAFAKILVSSLLASETFKQFIKATLRKERFYKKRRTRSMRGK